VSGLEGHRLEIRAMLLDPRARFPLSARPGDAGADLFATESVTVPPGERRDVGTGIALAIPEGHAGFVLPRSGLAFRLGITIVNAPGLIDAGYRGEVRVCLLNTGSLPFVISPGDRIAQLVIQRVERAEYLPVDALDPTERGTGGFGSTG
jgi:dUTP pyrophosphatase